MLSIQQLQSCYPSIVSPFLKTWQQESTSLLGLVREAQLFSHPLGVLQGFVSFRTNHVPFYKFRKVNRVFQFSFWEQQNVERGLSSVLKLNNISQLSVQNFWFLLAPAAILVRLNTIRVSAYLSCFIMRNFLVPWTAAPYHISMKTAFSFAHLSLLSFSAAVLVSSLPKIPYSSPERGLIPWKATRFGLMIPVA